MKLVNPQLAGQALPPNGAVQQPHCAFKVLMLGLWLAGAYGCGNYTNLDRLDSTVPFIGFTPNVQIGANTVNNQIGLNVSDNRTKRSQLIINAASSNQSVVANQNISVSGDNRILFISPRANVIGNTIISITVTDGNNNTASTFFTVSVVANQFNVSSFVTDAFNADANSEPEPLNTVELIQDAADDTAFRQLIDES